MLLLLLHGLLAVWNNPPAAARPLWRCVCFLTDDVMNVYLVWVSLFFPDACIYIYNRNSFEFHKRSSGNMYRGYNKLYRNVYRIAYPFLLMLSWCRVIDPCVRSEFPRAEFLSIKIDPLYRMSCTTKEKIKYISFDLFVSFSNKLSFIKLPGERAQGLLTDVQHLRTPRNQLDVLQWEYI